MGTPYSIIYQRCLQKLQDFDLANLPEDEIMEMLHGWLMSSIAKFRKCASDLSDRDDELATFNVDLVDEEIEILAIMMSVEWLQPQITSQLTTAQFFGGKEEKLWQFAHSSLCTETA